MANLSSIDKAYLESLFEMRSGYVLNFSNQTFEDFIREYTGLGIYGEKYHEYSGSKANRLRAFWKLEQDHIVGNLIGSLLDYYMAQGRIGQYDVFANEETIKACEEIAARLKRSPFVPSFGPTGSEFETVDFQMVTREVQRSIQNNEPQVGLDRLHTYMVSYIRSLCVRHEIPHGREETLNAIFGKYVKRLKEKSALDTVMAERILKSTISILDAFNTVRNEKSMAHGNELLNYDESLYIVTNVTSTVRFIESIEESLKPKIPIDDLPF